jgi:hypothetical protein
MGTESFFGRVRSLGNDPPAQAAFIADLLTLAAASAEEPLRRPSAPGPSSNSGVRLANAYQETVSMSIESLRRVQVRLPNGDTIGIGPEARVDWQQLHDAIQPADGPLWADIKSFLSDTGLALRHTVFTAEAGALIRAQRALRDMSEAIAGATQRLSPLAGWLDPHAAWPSASRRNRVLRELAREGARVSRYVVWRNAPGSWVFVTIGWFLVAGELRLGVALETDPAKRALRQMLLGSAQSLGGEWLLSRRGWAAIARYADQAVETADAPDWVATQVQRLFGAEMLAPLDRWGRPLGRSSRLPSFPKGRGRRQEEYRRQRSFPERAAVPKLPPGTGDSGEQ